MLITVKDYLLCYSTAYAVGVATGLLLAIALRHRPSKTATWRRRNVGKRVY
jgi:hypothetical protein